jgi:hypothetical protein
MALGTWWFFLFLFWPLSPDLSHQSVRGASHLLIDQKELRPKQPCRWSADQSNRRASAGRWSTEGVIWGRTVFDCGLSSSTCLPLGGLRWQALSVRCQALASFGFGWYLARAKKGSAWWFVGLG